jgi:hypothetical protein
MTQRVDSEESAKFLLIVLKAHGNDAESALDNAIEHFKGAYTVSPMIEDQMGLLTGTGGFTARRYRANLTTSGF